MITVKTQVKDIVKEAGIENMAGDVMERLDLLVVDSLRKAVERAKENGRRTLMGRDL